MTLLARRLAPLQAAVALEGMLLWVPVEKLFMSEIGFTAASIGVMAAAYAAVVPLLEVPSGLLADGGAAPECSCCPPSRSPPARSSAGSATA